MGRQLGRRHIQGLKPAWPTRSWYLVSQWGLEAWSVGSQDRGTGARGSDPAGADLAQWVLVPVQQCPSLEQDELSPAG